MEKKYLIVCVNDTPPVNISAGDAEVVYSVDNPFKKKLFDDFVKDGKTDLCDRKQFDKCIEIYRLLKQNEYLGYDKIKVSFYQGDAYEFTKEEGAMVADACENKIEDIKKLLSDVKKQLSEKPKEPRIVVYTCITGGYDSLIEPTVITPGVDYVCFTDNPGMKSKTWKIRPMPKELASYSKVKQQRGVKILAHRYLSEYDICVWVDGVVQVKGNIKEFFKNLDLNKYSVFIPEHPVRKCIYKEIKECIRIKKIKGDEIKLAEQQLERYRKEGFPENYGLVQTNVMIRRHNDEYSKKLMEKWWEELKDYSHRDQLSFNYALWKIGQDKFKQIIKTTCNSKTFNWLRKHKK